MPRTTAAPAASNPSVLPPGGSSERDGLFRRLSWLTLFRLVTITVLLGGTALTDFTWSGRLADGPGPLYALIALTYAASLAFALWLRTRRRLELMAHGQIALDVGVAAAVVALTGGSESVFVFLFLLAIVNGSLLLFQRGAFVGAGLSTVAYVLLVSRHHPGSYTLFAHAAALLATAALSSYLAEQLRRTGQKLAEREGDLAAIRALHESIVQSVSSGIITVDLQGCVTFLNRAGEQMLGVSAAELRGQAADRWLSYFQPFGKRDETLYENARGERLSLGYNNFPLVGGDGRKLGRAVIFQDLTRLRAMEAQVQRSERLADLGTFAAGLAHELRNPLASMCGSIELLRAAAVGDEERRLMDIVLREAARLEQLVSRFLAFTRPSTPRHVDVDLGELVRETVEVFANDPATARVDVETAIVPTVVSCDPDQMRQVLWNLLRNAAQAAVGEDERRGRVAVKVAPLEDDGAELMIEDDGPGIPPKDRERIFDPFFTTKERGIGMGLAVVQRIIDGHDGMISVEQAGPAGGARFIVRLPGPDGRARAIG